MVTSSSSSVNDEKIQKAGSFTIQYLMLTKTNYSVWSLKMQVNLQAQGVWDATQQADVEGAKVQTLRSYFEVIRIKNDESMDDFAMRLNTIVTSICSLGDSIEEITVVKKFLRPGEPSLLLTHAEWSSQSKRADEKDSLNSSKGKGGTSGQGHGRGRECPNKKKGEEANLTQTIDEEPTLMMAILQENASGKVFLNEEKVIANLLQTDEPRVESDMWNLDNGASNHMTEDRSNFHKLDERVTCRVKFGDGSTVAIMGKG
ncbi:zinc finger, CCHC-type containing protein [Tanacetum coccineum]